MNQINSTHITSNRAAALEYLSRKLTLIFLWMNAHTHISGHPKRIFQSTLIQFHCYIHFQLNWNIYPTCYLPEHLYGKPISYLNISTLSLCIEYIDDHYHMNGISENILRNTIQGMFIMCSKLTNQTTI